MLHTKWCLENGPFHQGPRLPTGVTQITICCKVKFTIFWTSKVQHSKKKEKNEEKEEKKGRKKRIQVNRNNRRDQWMNKYVREYWSSCIYDYSLFYTRQSESESKIYAIYSLEMLKGWVARSVKNGIRIDSVAIGNISSRFSPSAKMNLKIWLGEFAGNESYELELRSLSLSRYRNVMKWNFLNVFFFENWRDMKTMN